MLQNVEYRDVPGFPGYRVGSDGTFWSLHLSGRGKALGTEWKERKRTKPCPTTGYYTFSFHAPRRLMSLHTLVLLAFVGPKPPGMECRHLDGNKLNNRLENLQWGTRQENVDDRCKHGGTMVGSRHCFALLTEEVVADARQQAATGTPVGDIAESIGIRYATLMDAVAGRTWKHVPVPPVSPPKNAWKRGKRVA